MTKPITVCGLTFKFIRESAGFSTYLECKEVGLTLEILGENYYHPFMIYPTSFSLFEKNGPPGRDFYKGDRVEGSGESAEDAMRKFFLAWNRRLPAKLKELRAETACLEDFDTKFKTHAKVVIEPTVAELKAEVQRLKAKLAEKKA